MPKIDTCYPDNIGEWDLIVGGLIRKKYKRNESHDSGGQGYSGAERRGWISFEKRTPVGMKRVDVVIPPK